MKRFGFTGFFAVIVGILVAFTAYDYWSSQKNNAKKEQASKVVQLPADHLSRIEIVDRDGSVRKLEKTPKGWEITAPIQELADQQAVATYIESFAGEKIVQTIKEGGDVSLATYGLEKPQFEMKLRADGAASESAREQDIKIGSVKAFEGSLYGQIDNQKKVVLLTSAWDVILTKQIKELRDKRLYRGPMTVAFDRVTVRGRRLRDAQPFDYQLERKENAWSLKGVTGADAVDPENVKAWLEQIKALRGAEFASQAPGAVALKPDFTLSIERKGEPAYTLNLARDKKNFDLFEASSTDLPGGLATRVALAKGAVDGVWLGPDAFFSRLAPFDFDQKAVARVIYDDAKANKHLDSKVDTAHPDVMIAKIHALQAVRFLGPPKEKKFPSSLRLLNSSGGLVFEMSWGEPVTEAATAERPEARYLPVRTNLSKQVLGVAEKSVADLTTTGRN